ncbi:Hypothetical protein SCF082_LOCUS20510 [Durusdinium trenchii]|uniref:Photosystem I reaction center subunit IX n=1 Tax=Durusdinium trenchii TaxID=1381693 RepID=A0ABP0L2U2_9DINO
MAMPTAGRRSVLPLLAVFLVMIQLFPTSFVAPPAQQKQTTGALGVAGLAAGFSVLEPAHAGGGPFWDEIFPYSLSISFAIIWGIILGFVLLRLQEAFPE